MEDFGGALDRYLAAPYERGGEEARDFECPGCDYATEYFPNTGTWPCEECGEDIDTETDGPDPEEDCP